VISLEWGWSKPLSRERISMGSLFQEKGWIESASTDAPF